MKILAVDIGNTSATFGIYSHGKLGLVFRVPTRELGRAKLPRIAADEAAIASVVPSAGKILKKRLQRLGVKTRLVGADIRVPIKNRYKDPKQVGMDRLMNAVAFYHKYKKAGIVIDFGTAVTFDAVSAKGEYLGGVIAPGIDIALEALFQKTALLPRIRLAHPTGIIGRDTVDSIRAGAAYGIGGLCDGIVARLKAKLGKNTVVVATGGYAPFMKRYCASFKNIRPSLVLDGIYLTLKKSA